MMKRLRFLLLAATTALLVAFVPARWSVRLVLLVAVVALGLAWIAATVLVWIARFYWPRGGTT